MGSNVEIKARVPEPEALRARVATIADSGPAVLRQVDTFFRTRRGRLKLRETDSEPAELIYYERADRAGPGRSNYRKVPCPEPEALRQVLGRALGVRGVVRKERTLFRAGATRIHLDRVEGLGDFIELEVELAPEESAEDGAETASRLIRRLGIRREDLVREAYVDLLPGAAGVESPS